MFESLKKAFSIHALAMLFGCIFSGAIIGETVTLSIVVSSWGAPALSRLYLVNGSLLFLLPVFFFTFIDSVRREQLLSRLLSAITIFLLVYFVLYVLQDHWGGRWYRGILTIIYPVSYLSKTVLFLTFWTLANDIYLPHESKKSFPVISAWGFVGGLSGAIGATFLVQLVSPHYLILLWALLYGGARLLLPRLYSRYEHRLKEVEVSGGVGRDIKALVSDVVEIRLVRTVGVLYFCIFFSVFTLDYLFWKFSHNWFRTTASLASFQFAFYVVHSALVIVLLRFALPRLIRTVVFTRVLFSLPVALGGCALFLLWGVQSPLNARDLFALFIFLQFFRYVFFETAFSPLYQMIFTAIPRHRRGRAKMFCDGGVKPLAICASGLLLLIYGENTPLLLILICFASFGGILIVGKIRRMYVEELFPADPHHREIEQIEQEIGSYHEAKILSLIEEYAASHDAELQQFAVRVLGRQGSRKALDKMESVFDSTVHQTVREAVSRSLGGFFTLKVEPFIHRLLHDERNRIRANAIYSLNEMNCRWKRTFKPVIRSMLFENDIRITIEAARFLWKDGDPEDRDAIRKIIEALLASENSNKRSAALYCVGAIRPTGWEEVLLAHLGSSSLQVYVKSCEVLLNVASTDVQLTALQKVSRLTRHRIALWGHAACRAGVHCVDGLVEYLKSGNARRMFFEVVHALRTIRFEHDERAVHIRYDKMMHDRLNRWVLHELGNGYRDCYVFAELIRTGRISPGDEAVTLLESSLRERIERIAQWGIDALAIMDREGVFSRERCNADIYELSQRSGLIEILESAGESEITSLIVPIVRQESWERLGKRARSTFSLPVAHECSPGYFLDCENRWIVLSALHWLFVSRGSVFVQVTYAPVLQRLARGKTVQLVRAAEEIMNGNETISSFSILETVLFLKKTPLFKRVSGERLFLLAELCIRQRYEAGTVISRQGDVSDCLFIVIDGTVEVKKKNGGQLSLLATLSTGDTYGEIGLFNQAPRSASACAGTACSLYTIQRSALKRVIMHYPEIAYNFLEIFGEKLRKSGEEISVSQTSLST